MRSGPRTLPASVAAVVALVSITVPIGSAGAALSPTDVVVPDADDVTIPLDIKSVSYRADAASVTFGVETFANTADVDTAFSWLVDTTGDGSYDFDIDVRFDPATSGFVGVVATRSGSVSAPVVVSRPTAATLVVRVAIENLGRPTTLEYQTVATTDLNTDGVVQDGEIDVAGVDGQGDLVVRFAGGDRIETAIAASEATFFNGGADAVVLAVSTNFADALGAAPLAAHKGGPLLLTGTDELDPRTEREMRRVLTPGGTVYVLGGVAALSAAVASRAAALGVAVTRYGGTNRFETAIEIADKGLGNPATLLLSTGTDFPDGLTAGAAAASRSGAVLLTDGTTMPPAVAAYIQARPSAQRYAIGFPASVADPTATPVAGADRYETARRTAEVFFLTPGRVGIAVGTNFPDALSGGANMAVVGGPLLLTPPEQLSALTTSYLSANARTIVAGAVFGGRAVVPDAVRTAVATAIK